ncbi:MAG: sporulation membrane protein YtaF [Clostridiales bacterium]|nr:sporulation membrane protein YtaF [Clostridiales bacterium]
MSLYSVLEALMIVTALSTDAFVSAFAYGGNKIRIPFASVAIISLVCSAILAASLFFGAFLSPFIPRRITALVCFFILFILGFIKIFDSTLKAFIRKHNKLRKDFRFSAFNLKFVLHIYANPQEADLDSSRILSPFEAGYLALALSADGLAAGFGAGLTDVDHLLLVLFSLAFNMAAVLLGASVGKKLAEKLPLNLSWLSGLLLIVLGIIKLF